MPGACAQQPGNVGSKIFPDTVVGTGSGGQGVWSAQLSLTPRKQQGGCWGKDDTFPSLISFTLEGTEQAKLLRKVNSDFEEKSLPIQDVANPGF